jgi:hypothetical protein
MLATMNLLPTDPVACFLALLVDHEQAAHARRPLLTEAGIAHLRGLLEKLQSPALASCADRPRWDAGWRRLYLGTRLLKEFRQPAPLQTAVLDAFEKKGWPTSPVANPLPFESSESELDVRQRLHETAKNLNRGMPRNTVRFRQNKNMVLCEWHIPLGQIG